MTQETNNEILHSGTKGMHWGIRLYQNKDGSLTQLGKARYRTKTNFNKVQSAKKAVARAKEADARKKQDSKISEKAAEIKVKAAGIKAKKYEAKTKKPEEKSSKLEEAKKQDTVSKKETTAKNDKPIDARKLANKKISEMTNEEIQARIDRVKLENSLKDITPKTITKAEKFKDAMADAAIAGISNASRDLIEKGLKKVGTDFLGLDESTVKSASEKLKQEAEDWKNREQIKKSKDAVNGTGKKQETESERLKREAEDATNKYKAKKYENEYNEEVKRAAANASTSEKKESTTSEKKESTTPKVERFVATADDVIDGNRGRSSYSNEPKKPRGYYDPIDSTGRVVTPSSSTDIVPSNNSSTALTIYNNRKKKNQLSIIHHSGINTEETTDEFYHHGIKGQKWGVRRYQNENGSLTTAGKEKLQKYKEKEHKAIDRKYNSDVKGGLYGIQTLRKGSVSLEIQRKNLESKIEKKKLNGEDASKELANLAATKHALKTNEALRKLEHKKVNDLTYDKMVAEKKAYGKAVAKDVLISTGGIALGAVTGMYVITTTNSDNAKTNMRINSKEKSNITGVSESYNKNKK